MVQDQQVEDSHLRKNNKEAKKARSFVNSSSKSRLDVQDKPKFKKRFPIRFLLISSRILMIEVLILTIEGEKC